MAPRAALLLCALALSADTVRAARMKEGALELARQGALGLAKQRSAVSAEQEIDKDTTRKIMKIINSGTALVGTLVDVLTETDPDIEFALTSLDIQGWQLVSLWVYDDQRNSEAAMRAKIAWDNTFKDIPGLVRKIQSSWESGSQQGALEVLLDVVHMGLHAASEVDPSQAKLVDALSDLVQGLGETFDKFNQEMGLLSDGTSLAQLGDRTGAGKWDTKTVNQLLTTSVGLLTTFVTAVTEDPPDFRYAFDSFKVQGWQLAKIMVPRETQRESAFKNAKKAWDRVWADAPVLTEKALAAYQEGLVDKTVDLVASTVETGLRAAASIDEARAKTYTAVADLVEGVKRISLKFAHDVGLLESK